MYTHSQRVVVVVLIGALPVPKGGVELDDDVLFLLGDVPPLHVRPEVVDPPQPAALAAPEQPCSRDIYNTRIRDEIMNRMLFNT